MSVISFWGNCEKETGQTISAIAVSTLMAIDHNYKVLSISTGFKDRTIEESFWVKSKTNSMQKALGIDLERNSIESGIEGLSRIVQSNIIRQGIVANYVRVVFRDRLDVLPSPITENSKEYIEISKNYPKIIDMANKDYNMVFVDIDKRMPSEIQKNILAQSDVIVVTTSQSQKNIDKFVKLKKENELFRNPNIMLLIGKYDRFSKYNIKNITRYLKERKVISAISYNTLFFEATSEGKVADYFLKYRNISDKTDRNSVFMEETKQTCDNILYTLQETRRG